MSNTIEMTGNEDGVLVEDKVVEDAPTVKGAVAASSTFSIELALITNHYNPRDVFPTLTVQYGHEFISLIKMSLGTPEEKAEFCRLIEEYENEGGEVEGDGDEGDEGEKPKLSPGKSTIIQVANSIRKWGQLQPVGVRKFGTHKVVKNGKTVGVKTTYGLVYGGRRVAAVAYNHAKHGLPAVVNGTILSRCRTSEDAFDLAVEENAHRRDFTDLEWGQIIHIYHQDMKLKYTEIAEKLNKPYQFVRGRGALATADPKLIDDLEQGKIILTDAIKIALQEKTATKRSTNNPSGAVKVATVAAVAEKRRNPPGTRQRPLTIKQMQAMFDQTSRDNDERLETLAQCMQVSLDEELEASDARIAAKKAGKTTTDEDSDDSE